MDNKIEQFVLMMFGPILKNSALTEEQKQQVVQSMMIFVFAHRHNKGDRFIVETQEAAHGKDTHFDFSVVRNVMYLYSKRA